MPVMNVTGQTARCTAVNNANDGNGKNNELTALCITKVNRNITQIQLNGYTH